jgi:ketosteroid isomerase-like protein
VLAGIGVQPLVRSADQIEQLGPRGERAYRPSSPGTAVHTVSCQVDNVNLAVHSEGMTADSRSTVETLFAALESGDLDMIRPHLAADVVEVIPFAPNGRPEPFGVFTGKDAVLKYLENIVRAFSRRALTDLALYATGDGGTVFAEATGDLIQAGTGTPYRNVYVFKFTFRDGKIAHIAEYANPVTFAKLTGMPIG